MRNITVAIIIKNGKVLIQHRFRPRVGFVYEFPGGAIDKGETPQEGAAREAWEEVGIRPKDILANHEYINDFGGKVYFVIFELLANEEPVMVDAIRRQTFYWFKANEIPLDDFYKADKEFILNCLAKYC